MKRTSIAWQMFIAIMSALLIVVVLHAVFFHFAFMPLYKITLLRDIENGFSASCEDFAGQSEKGMDPGLLKYTSENETAVFVFDEHYEILDGTLFSNLTTLTIKTVDGALIKLPVSFLKELPEVSSGAEIYVSAARLGESNYYAPYNIRANDITYYDRNTPIPQDAEIIGDYTGITKTWYTAVEGSKTVERAWLLYESMKDCLIGRENIEAYLSALTTGEHTQKNGAAYRFFSASRIVNGQKVYFVTLGTVAPSGSEARYMRSYLTALYAAMFVMLACMAFYLSRRLSRPMVELSTVTRHIAQRDFAVRAKVKTRDELGQLAANINLMADSLENAIAELSEAARQARENEARIKQLIADLTHEFKTPLGIIGLYAEVIEAEKFEKDRSYYFGVLNSEIENLTRIVDDTIQLSKLQSGQWKYTPSNYYLYELVTSALTPFNETIKRNSLCLTVNVPDIEVWADGVRIRQVLTNLISNAIKYSSGERAIRIEASLQDGVAVVSIYNTGEVSKEDLERIWNRYYRAADDTKTRLPSEGIGLDIVREILRMHGSNYGVTQRDGEICFYFSLKTVGE